MSFTNFFWHFHLKGTLQAQSLAIASATSEAGQREQYILHIVDTLW